LHFLIIQTSFIGDVILATSVAEKLHQKFPNEKIDFLLRKGNESLLENHPFINEVLIWNKKENKLSNLFKVISKVRRNKYDYVINLHRFASSGLITALSGAKDKRGYDKNPLSFLFTKKVKHEIGNGKHETERYQDLIKDITDNQTARPRLYPSTSNFKPGVPSGSTLNFVTISPASVWFTKQLPKEKWIELINSLDTSTTIYLLGSPLDVALGEEIKAASSHPGIINLAGKLSLLESAALMQKAQTNYVNDSAPLHIASAMNAPVTAVFCSTSPAFGFGPLSDDSRIVETKVKLECKPCGLHGYKACPFGHFKCALTIDVKDLTPSPLQRRGAQP
jgi:lipopolysaccharide heptosyltransferase II